MEKIERTSMNLVEEKLKKIKEVIPEAFIEGKIDFGVLQEELGKFIDKDNERYSFNWKGKSEARRIAQEMSTKTLRPNKVCGGGELSNNIYIEGDNLEVLKLLQKSYYKKVKMIYIDPPYNTGNDFVYKDDFKVGLKNYLKQTGQIGEAGQKLSTNSESSGRYHSNWLNMMYPRLKLARNLLTDDGVIFISIDDNEQENLKKICDEIFGESNFIANIIWKRKRGRDNSAKYFSKSHEYLMVYSKDKNNYNTNFLELDENTKKAYKNPDGDSRGNYRILGCWARGSQGGVKYSFTTKEGQFFKERLWLMSKEKLEKLDEENKLIIRGDNIYRKMFIYENKGRIPETLWDNVSNAANASEELKNIFEKKIIFDTPKPILYIQEMLKISLNKSDIILDFFSGSATTAHAVMDLNAEDGGNRKFIMVQLPELTYKGKTEDYIDKNGEKQSCYIYDKETGYPEIDTDSPARKAGYYTICEIGKERIRRAGKMIKERIEKENAQLKLGEEPKKIPDVGFKVFKLDSSNIKEWDPATDNLEKSLFDSVDNIKEDRTPMDLLYEILLKYGLDLNVPIEEKKDFYLVAGGTLIVNLENKINLETINSICETYKELLEIDKDFKTTVVLRDSAFSNDAIKTNAIKRLEQAGISEVRSI